MHLYVLFSSLANAAIADSESLCSVSSDGGLLGRDTF
jgi:hypothetical protein